MERNENQFSKIDRICEEVKSFTPEEKIASDGLVELTEVTVLDYIREIGYNISQPNFRLHIEGDIDKVVVMPEVIELRGNLSRVFAEFLDLNIREVLTPIQLEIIRPELANILKTERLSQDEISGIKDDLRDYQNKLDFKYDEFTLYLSYLDNLIDNYKKTPNANLVYMYRFIIFYINAFANQRINAFQLLFNEDATYPEDPHERLEVYLNTLVGYSQILRRFQSIFGFSS